MWNHGIEAQIALPPLQTDEDQGWNGFLPCASITGQIYAKLELFPLSFLKGMLLYNAAFKKYIRRNIFTFNW